MRAGIDSHKRTLAVAVVDDAGRQIAVEAFANDPKGHLRLGKWLADHGVTRVGIEGSGHLGRAAAAWLLDVGFDVREVPCGPRGDAVAVHSRSPGSRPPRSTWSRPAARTAPPRLRILNDYRRQLVTERIRLVNRVHADLVIVVPGYNDKVLKLTPAH